MKKILGMLALGLMLSGAVNKASAVEVRGVASCGTWIQEQKADDSHISQLWLLGFMSGLATGLEKDLLNKTDSPSIFLWMDNYCKANPLKDVYDGGVALSFELTKRKKIK